MVCALPDTRGGFSRSLVVISTGVFIVIGTSLLCTVLCYVLIVPGIQKIEVAA